jgi:hypothetical protein
MGADVISSILGLTLHAHRSVPPASTTTTISPERHRTRTPLTTTPIPSRLRRDRLMGQRRGRKLWPLSSASGIDACELRPTPIRHGRVQPQTLRSRRQAHNSANSNQKTARSHDPSLQDQFVRTGLTWSFNVQKYSKPLPDSHQVSGLPLFDWRHVVVWSPASPAVQFVMRRYRVAPHTAEVIAVLAGLGAESSR